MIFQILPEDWKTTYAKVWFNGKRRRAFYRKVSELYINGIKVDEIVKSLYRRSIDGKKSKDGVEPWIYQHMMRGMASTGNLSSGTKGLVPAIDQLLITAGERGDFPDVLRSAADLNEKMYKVKGLIRKALSYPLFIICLVIVSICWFGASLFPTMEGFLPVEEWPPISQVMYSFSSFMLYFWPMVILAIGGIAGVVWWSFANFTGPIRLKLDKMPPWSLYRLSQGGAWIMSITSMVGAGIMNTEAIQNVYNESKGNPWLRERTKAVQDNISRGSSMGKALMTQFHFPDWELCQDMIDYSISANFNQIFEKVGKEWIDISIEKVEEQTKLMNGIAIVTALLSIAVLAQSMVALMMKFTNMLSAPAM